MQNGHQVGLFLDVIPGILLMLLRTISTLIAAHLAAFATSLSVQEKVDMVKVPLPAGLLARRIYRMTPDGKVTIFRAESGRTNGNTFDAQGRLISCNRGRRAQDMAIHKLL
jgi:hypothetical protein